jgi:hypothetical protein
VRASERINNFLHTFQPISVYSPGFKVIHRFHPLGKSTFLSSSSTNWHHIGGKKITKVKLVGRWSRAHGNATGTNYKMGDLSIM